jgi:hypothetical protein
VTRMRGRRGLVGGGLLPEARSGVVGDGLESAGLGVVSVVGFDDPHRGQPLFHRAVPWLTMRLIVCVAAKATRVPSHVPGPGRVEAT